MTDPTPQRPDERAPFGAPPPPPPPPPPLPSPGTSPAGSPPPGSFATAPGAPGTLPAYPPSAPSVVRRGGGRLVPGVLGVALLVGGVGFAVARAADDGPATPEAAVEDLVDALVDRDVLGVLEVMPAGERRALQDPLRDISSELVRLGVLDETFDLGGISGLELSVDDLALRTEQVHDDLAAVTVTGGTVTGTVTPDELPLGRHVRRWIEDDPYSSLEPATATESLSTPDADDVVLMAVRDGGGWRVSLGYTIAENARIAEGLPRPDPAAAVVARGAASPEEAVEQAIRAASDLDVRRVIELLPPDEMGALQAYAPLFLDDLEAEAARERERYDVERLDVDLASERSGGVARVRLERAALEIVVDGERVVVDFDGDCLEIDEGQGREQVGCLSDLDDLEVPIDLDLDLLGLLAVTTVEVDGGWYVSPTRTVLDGVTTTLRALPDDAVEHLGDLVDEVLWEVEQGVGTTVETFEPTTDPYGGSIDGPVGRIDDLPEWTDDEWDDEWDEWDDPWEPGTPPPSTTAMPAPPNRLEPSQEGLAATVRGWGYVGQVADCIAAEIYQLGFGDEVLLALEIDDHEVLDELPQEWFDQILAVTEDCEERGP